MIGSDVGEDTGNDKKNVLQKRFIVPPFSLLDTQQGYWKGRKKQWLDMGIMSEMGRSENLTYAATHQPPAFYEVKNELKGEGLPSAADDVINECIRRGIKLFSGTSIFDPVLCECVYRWFMPSEGGVVVDPFCGGSVRGIVAAKCGYRYWGNDLRQEQVDANVENVNEVLDNYPIKPIYSCGDSRNIKTLYHGECDLIFSCPPYADLEVYSDDPNDLSNMEYDEFLEKYQDIIRSSCELLKEDRFAVFVVGEVRGKDGVYYNFVGDTISAFLCAGMKYYNEIILATSRGSAAITAGRQFNGSRKIGKVHQNILVFYKGDLKKIKENYKPIDLSYLEELNTDEQENEQ